MNNSIVSSLMVRAVRRVTRFIEGQSELWATLSVFMRDIDMGVKISLDANSDFVLSILRAK